MALPTLSARWPGRVGALERQLVRQREQEARWRQQWELHSQYFREQEVRSSKQAHWSSRHSFQRSMSAFQRERVKEEKQRKLQERRERLMTMLQEERDQLEAELKNVLPDRATQTRELVEKTDVLRSAREERRKNLAQELLREHWKQNNSELQKVESQLHKDHVVSQWQAQQQEKKQAEERAQEEKRRVENEYERARQEALERMKKEEEKRKQEKIMRAEDLRKQMEELKLQEQEAERLKKEQETLLSRCWELEKLEDERRRMEETRRKTEFGHFLTRQYRTQLKRRAQQVQEELEADRKILAALVEGELEEQKLEKARRERAVDDAAWMKRVIEEQLQLEKEREAEFDILYREEAQRVWEKREAEWEKEKRARERLMREVLAGRQLQLEEQMHENRLAREESLRRREELIQQLDQERLTQCQEKEVQEGARTARMQEINVQVEKRRKEQLEEQQRLEQEEEQEREGLKQQEEELHLETERLIRQGYRERIHSRPRSAWT
ncbi:Trichoplein keratin filament-binding protein [Triplophysa tibetana]|uniref:Trichoplein keratin filament-binding protein n=1 Tax=Triplophysa tibetana TaxID=1572043 RepID=A0A5A9P7Q8_9TELE|nr:Trichoplein keratin filament-binding protein [Triplophysa tibetana]